MASKRSSSKPVPAWVVEQEPKFLMGWRSTSVAAGYIQPTNPWVPIASQLHMDIDRRPPVWGTQYRDLGFPRNEQDNARAAMQAWFARLVLDPPASDCAADALPPEPTWRPYIRAMAGFISGVDPALISARDLINYDEASTGCNWRVPAGYGTLVVSSVPATGYRCDTAVESLMLDSSGVRLETKVGTIKARAVILTISAGIVRVKSILPARASRRTGAPLFLLTN